VRHFRNAARALIAWLPNPLRPHALPLARPGSWS
jgi:hypothetical protein